MTVTRYGPLPDGGDPYDVTVVGAGVVGSAIARALARLPLRTALIDASDDVGSGTSKANTAILHTGFDAVPGSLESRLVRDGQRLLASYAAQSGIPVEPVGALLVAWNEEQLAALPALADKAVRNGYRSARILAAADVRSREPQLGPGVLGALHIPDESLICPWTTTLAYATQAVRAGVHLHLNCPVRSVTPGEPHTLTTGRGPLRTRHLVNAAGLYADDIDRFLGHADFTVTPRRGQLIVFDELARGLLRHILLPVPDARGKGVLVTPTVYGNVLLGPTAEDLDDKTDTGSTAEGLALLREKGRRILPALLDEEVTAVYAGLRAATGQEDYAIRAHPRQRYVTVGGIRSTGLTASMAIADHVVDLLAEGGLPVTGAREPDPVRMPNLGEAFPRPYRDAAMIAADPDYGRIVCHCERVTRGEIRDALASTVAPASPDGLRRRTRTRDGRCQGFHCGAAVRALFEEARR
ncbi:FAD-dependent oxidoreductase [Streptomyces sp. NPDC056254]|uniref:FAD-dependent oxidoreductase n=1 Tax=Streptomyces sp. NPDC056254 TaxID=3345763 RepID=UPI0035E16BB4